MGDHGYNRYGPKTGAVHLLGGKLIHALVAKIYPDKIVRRCADGAFFCEFVGPVFSASRVQHISDLRPKLALRPHHVWKYGRHSIYDR